jgi:hypothetical protein
MGKEKEGAVFGSWRLREIGIGEQRDWDRVIQGDICEGAP